MPDQDFDIIETNESNAEAPLESEAPSTLRRRKLGSILLVLFFIGVTFLCGYLVGSKGLLFGLSKSEGKAQELANRIDEVAKLLDADAIYDIDLDEATDDALGAIVDTMDDKYAEYYNDAEYSKYQMYLKGSFMGIGVSIATVSNGTIVTGVYRGSAAEEAGVKPGDSIVTIDGDDGSGTSAGHWTSSEAAAAIKRGEGEGITIVWNRMSDEDLDQAFSKATSAEDFEIVEGEKITTTMVYSKVDFSTGDYSKIGDFGYIRLYTFDAEAAEFVQDALKSLMGDGVKGIVLDLRENGGGYLKQAVAIVSLFATDGIVVSYERKSKSKSTQLKVSGKAICDLPLAILVNGSSASASEVSACALRDLYDAVLVGTTTYGKGTVQDCRPLSFGGGLKYTIAHYKGPEGEQIDGVGLEPDIEVEDVDFRDYGTPGKDLQLDAAIEYLKSAL